MSIKRPQLSSSNARLQVVMMTASFYPNTGGLETTVMELAAHLMIQGHRVLIVAARWPKGLPAEDTVNGLKILRLPFRLPAFARPWTVLSFLVRYVQCMLSMCLCRDLWGADLIHLHYPAESALYARRLSRRLGIPLVTSLHGNDIMQFAETSRTNRKAVSRALQASTFVTANSSYLLRIARRSYGREIGAKGIVIWNGVKTKETADPIAQPADRHLLAVGRLVRKKGFDVLLRALALLNHQASGNRLVIVGDGPERTALENLARSLGVFEQIDFAGNVSRESVWEYYRNASLFVLPSRVEPFGIVSLEAMAAGLAVVATNVGGIPEVVLDGHTGLLVSPDRPDSLAQAIDSLLGDSLLRERLGKAGYDRARREFTWERIAGQFVSVYRSA